MKSIIVMALKSVIIFKNRVLVVQRDANEDNPNTWEFVGGKLDFGEDIEKALKREIKREVNLDVLSGRLLYATAFKQNDEEQIITLTYSCFAKHENVVLSSEHKKFKWANRKLMMKLLPESTINDINKNIVLDNLGIH